MDKKRSRGLPPGPVLVSDSFSDGDLLEVEFIVGDTSYFEDIAVLEPTVPQEYDSEIYEPKVSSWGVFP